MIPDPLLRAVLDPPAPAWSGDAIGTAAAVLAPWFTRDGRDWLLYTVRQSDLPHHAGEVAFPGGRRHAGEDALTCALREAEEEIGLCRADVTPLGRLGDRRSSVGYRVQAFVARIAPPDALRLDAREVAAVFSIPVDELCRPERWEYREIGSGERRRTSPFFAFEDRLVWGLTGWLTRDLVERLERLERRGV